MTEQQAIVEYVDGPLKGHQCVIDTAALVEGADGIEEVAGENRSARYVLHKRAGQWGLHHEPLEDA